jgi:pimeloyl-ACP methyl ester carboxylesterase
MLELHYKTFGEGKPLIILHGLFGMLDNWITHGKTFANGRQVFLLDQRNHGRSPHTDEFNYDLLAHDLKDFMDARGIENPDLLGHSMGGKTVMQFAAFYPHEFDRMIVADIAPRQYPVHHGTIIEALRSVDVKNLTSRSRAEEILAESIHTESTRQFLLKNLYRTDEGAFAWRFNLESIAANIVRIGEATQYTLPVEKPALFIRGEHSDYVHNSDWDLICEIFPEAKLESIAGAGHWLHADKPKEFAEIVTNFLSE